LFGCPSLLWCYKSKVWLESGQVVWYYYCTMLNKFGNITKRVAPILDLMSEETSNIKDSIHSGNFMQLGNTVERLGLLTSRLYSEYLSGQNAFAENPDLLNEALNILTKSQEATIEAQRILNTQAQSSLSGVEGEEEENKEPFLVKLERKVTIVSAIAIPAWLFYVSKDFGPIKRNITKGFALTSGLVALRYYTKQHGAKNVGQN